MALLRLLFPQEKRDGENVVTGTGDDHSVSSLQRPKVEVCPDAAGENFEKALEFPLSLLRHFHLGSGSRPFFLLGLFVVHETEWR